MIALVAAVALLTAAAPSSHEATVVRARELAGWLRVRAVELEALSEDAARSAGREDRARVERELIEAGCAPRLARALSAAPPDAPGGASLHLVRRRLDGFTDAQARPATEPRADAKVRLSRILADPRFDTPAPEPGLLRRAMRWVQRTLGRLLARTFDAMAGGGFVVALLLLALAVGVAAWLIARALRGLGRARRDAPAVLWAEPAARDPQAGLDAARRLFETGQTVRALARLEGVVVAWLRERGDLPPEPGLTDIEALRWLARESGPDLREAFARLAELHDLAVYGGRSVPPEAAAAVLAEWTARLQAAPVGRAA